MGKKEVSGKHFDIFRLASETTQSVVHICSYIYEAGHEVMLLEHFHSNHPLHVVKTRRLCFS